LKAYKINIDQKRKEFYTAEKFVWECNSTNPQPEHLKAPTGIPSEFGFEVLVQKDFFGKPSCHFETVIALYE
jgi:hypothetical protein